jgi:hypothetical protein
MSDEIDRQKVEAWFDPPVKIPRPILDSMAADLAQAQARADALAVENAELRAALDALNVVIPDLHEVKGFIREQGREPDDGFPIMLCLDLGDIRRAVDLLAADPAQRGADLLAAADRLGEAVQRWLDDPDVDATQAETDLLGNAYGEWINCRLRGGPGQDGEA